MQCQHQHQYDGYRSYGDDIPAMAQGAYFPGDEPQARCDQHGEACNPSDVQRCKKWSATDFFCPTCEMRLNAASILQGARLYEHEDGSLKCSVCGEGYTPMEALAAMQDYVEGTLYDLRQEQQAHADLKTDVAVLAHKHRAA